MMNNNMHSMRRPGLRAKPGEIRSAQILPTGSFRFR